MTTKELELRAARGRLLALEMVYRAASGHIGGSLSAMDALTELYFEELRVDPANPQDPERDRFVMSKGHCTPALYAVLALRGYFPQKQLELFRSIDGHMSGHPDMVNVPGVDMSTGSLGQGLACGVGMAIAAKLDQKDYRVFVAVGDGECNEGEIWEACGTAYKYQCDNLVVFVDYNNLQLDGTCDEIMPPVNLGDKFKAFGFDVYEINGNDMEEMVRALDLAVSVKNGKPKCIFGHTVKGNGVSFMENQVGWHGTAPNKEQYEQAMAELEQQYVEC